MTSARAATTTRFDGIRLEDPDYYLDPSAGFANLRDQNPVAWYEPLQSWIVSRYKDIQFVCTADDEFTTLYGVSLGPQFNALRRATWSNGCPVDLLGTRDAVARSVNASHDAEQLLRVDPPRHTEMRGILRKLFTPRAVAGLEPVVREMVCRKLESLPADEPIDFVKEVALPVPLFVAATIIGIPADDQERFRIWTEIAQKFSDGSEEVTAHELASFRAALDEMYGYFGDRLAEATSGTGSLIGCLVGGTLDGEPLPRATMQSLCRMVLVGGNETTRHLMSSAALTLSEHPDQRAKLVARPQLMANALEELLRWITPVRHFCRTTTRPVRIGDAEIPAGEYVTLLLSSGNRDERVWPDAHVFDVERPVVPRHLTFSYGTHLCLGQHFTRLETQILFEELLKRYPNYEVVGEPESRHMVFLNGLQSLRVRLQP